MYMSTLRFGLFSMASTQAPTKAGGAATLVRSGGPGRGGDAVDQRADRGRGGAAVDRHVGVELEQLRGLGLRSLGIREADLVDRDPALWQRAHRAEHDPVERQVLGIEPIHGDEHL